MNMIDIIILLLILAAVFAAVRCLVQRKKAGGCAGCSCGSCSGCGTLKDSGKSV
ncbi:MAG: FeoB-associated Cys-rich membrane protein [Lachnospiraceae bacterium]|nr:FeoB-associated Cys-rich membrane protein [Lachnospiraceae bacterium]MBR2532218.1 FeoB-associated Cys-rich membrane protein [Lachnospiraceae bacterium]